MADDSEFGEFSSGGEEWNKQNHLTPSFTPDWLAYSDNQDWASGVIPNNEQPWNASFPELPKELSNLLSDDITSLGEGDALATDIINLPTNGSGHDIDEFGDFECSLDNPEVVMTTDEPITRINAPLSSNNNIDSTRITDKAAESRVKPAFAGTGNLTVDEDDEFGDFEGPSIPKQPATVQASNIVSEPKDEVEGEFGGFVSTTTVEVKEKTSTADDDFGSFEAAEFVSTSSFPPIQTTLPTASTVAATPNKFGATPISKSPASFSTVAESCFHCSEQTGFPQSTTDHQPLNTLAQQSR